MTRRRDDVRIVPTLALTASLIALLAFAIQYPTAATWTGVVALALATCGPFTLAAETMGLRDQLDAERDAFADLADDNARLVAALAEATAAQAAAGIPLRLAPVVPIQRRGAHDRLTDDDWFARLYDENGNPRS
jgi:hypothetical protein